MMTVFLSVRTFTREKKKILKNVMLLYGGQIFYFYSDIKLLKVNKEGDMSRNAQRSWAN